MSADFRKAFTKILEDKVDEVKEKSLWINAPFKEIKYISTTDVGEIGETFIADALRSIGMKGVERPPSKRGEFDISVKGKYKIEVKTATLDTSKGFQFNGIRFDTKYNILICFGIGPDDIYFLVYKKNQIVDLKFVSMSKGANAGFKYSVRQSKMMSIDKFKKEIKKIIK